MQQTAGTALEIKVVLTQHKNSSSSYIVLSRFVDIQRTLEIISNDHFIGDVLEDDRFDNITSWDFSSDNEH